MTVYAVAYRIWNIQMDTIVGIIAEASASLLHVAQTEYEGRADLADLYRDQLKGASKGMASAIGHMRRFFRENPVLDSDHLATTGNDFDLSPLDDLAQLLWDTREALVHREDAKAKSSSFFGDAVELYHPIRNLLQQVAETPGIYDGSALPEVPSQEIAPGGITDEIFARRRYLRAAKKLHREGRDGTAESEAAGGTSLGQVLKVTESTAHVPIPEMAAVNKAKPSKGKGGRPKRPIGERKTDERIYKARHAGTDYKEIAKEFNCTVGEVKAACDRTRKRKKYEDERYGSAS